MSANVATADLWIADLEDIFGLSPADRPDAVAASGPSGRAVWSKLLFLAALVIALSALVLAVARLDFGSSDRGASWDAGQVARVEPRASRSGPRPVAAPADAVSAPNVARGMEAAGERSVIAPVADDAERRETRAARGGVVERTPRAVGDANAGGETIASPTEATLGRGTAAAPDPSGASVPPPPVRSASDASSADADVRIVNAPAAPRALVVTDGSSPFPPEPRASPAPAASEKKTRNKAEAIDALRMLRRQ